jgi:hypothetical protein
MTVLVSARVKIALAIWALVATLLAGYLSVALEKRYLDHHPYFFDAVSYSFYNAKLYQRIQEAGQSEVLSEELKNNNRHPLRTVPLIVFSPQLLTHPYGHMATTLPSLFIFVFLLAHTIYRRMGRFGSAIVVSSIVLLLPGLHNPVSGIATYWLDLTAALLIGAAALALLNSNRGQDLRWLILFVFLGSCATFARYISIAYLLFACAPVFIWFLITRVREEGNWPRSVLLPILVTIGIGALFSGPYLFAHAGSVREFYQLYGYALGVSVLTSIRALMVSMKGFIGAAGVLALFVLTGAYLLKLIRVRRLDVKDLFVPIWLALSIPIFQGLVLRTWAPHTISYAAILLLISLAMLWAKWANESGILFKRVGLVILLIMGSGWGGYYASEWKLASHPSQEAAEAKLLQTQLADQLARYGQKIVWNAYFDEVSWIPSLDAFYRYGMLPLPLGQDYVFSIHESVYRGNYPGWDSAKIHEALLKNANSWLNIAVVFDDLERVSKVLPNELSRSAAVHIARSIKNGEGWSKIFQIESEKYGKLVGYINLHPNLDGYDAVLAGRAKLRPLD